LTTCRINKITKINEGERIISFEFRESQSMIKLFVLDLDGCVSMPFELPDWSALFEIMHLNKKSSSEEYIPSITICSGRPLPYVEAIGQYLGVRHPLVFESGGGMYNPLTNKLSWNPVFDDGLFSEIKKIKEYVTSAVIPSHPGTILEFTKKTDVGIINQNEETVNRIFNELKSFVADAHHRFEVHKTEISVNCIVGDANKGSGLKWLSETTEIPLNNIAYIGDSSGDVPALQLCGYPFSPSNAVKAVKKISTAMSKPATAGVLEAYKKIIELNKQPAATKQ